MWLLSVFYHRPHYNNWSQRQTIGTNQSLKHFSFISVHLQSIWESYDIVLWYSTYLQRNSSWQGAHQAHRQLKTGCRKGYIIHESHFWTQINAEHNTPLVLPQRTSACVSPITSCRTNLQILAETVRLKPNLFSSCEIWLLQQSRGLVIAHTRRVLQECQVTGFCFTELVKSENIFGECFCSAFQTVSYHLPGLMITE